MEVWADWQGLRGETLVGRLTAQVTRGTEVASFEYDDEWLKGARVQIDPHLTLFEGRQYPHPPLEQFGAFSDASPDRWGRTLLDRREALRARQEGRQRRTLMPLDYLLGVHDGIGAVVDGLDHIKQTNVDGDESVGHTRIGAIAPHLVAVEEPVVVSVGVEGIGAPADLIAVNKAVLVGVGVGGRRPACLLLPVVQPVVVGV